MDALIKRGILVIGAFVALYLIIKYVLPILIEVLGVLALIIGWLILIVVIIIAVWFFVQKFK